MAVRAYGTSINYLPAYDSVATPTLIGSLSSIGEVGLDSDEIDVTTLDSPGGYREFLQGFKDSGELACSGYHDGSAAQGTVRTLYGTGASGYWWITFPDSTAVIFTAYVKGYNAGAFEVDGAVGFGLSLRITGLVQVITIKEAVGQSKSAGQTATMDATATAYTGSPTYQWYSNDEENYDSPSSVGGATSASYTTGALNAGTYYYFCAVTVTGYRAVNSQIHKITVS